MAEGRGAGGAGWVGGQILHNGGGDAVEVMGSMWFVGEFEG